MARLLATCALLIALLVTPTNVSAAEPASWDNLVKVPSKGMKAVYLLPGADFRPYTKVMLDPTEVAFQNGWQRNYNRSAQLQARLSNADAAKIADAARTGFHAVMEKTYGEAGYPVVTVPGPDVLRLVTRVVNLSINAPDTGTGHIYSAEAGEAAVVIEAHDSLTNAILGRAVDQREAGTIPGLRTRASNRADFLELFEAWAKSSVRGLNELKAMSPIDARGLPSKP